MRLREPSSGPRSHVMVTVGKRGVVLTRRQLDVLGVIERTPYGRLSIKKSAQAMGVSELTVRKATQALTEKRLVTCHARYHLNGAQLENGYRLTALGRAVLYEAAREDERAAAAAGE